MRRTLYRSSLVAAAVLALGAQAASPQATRQAPSDAIPEAAATSAATQTPAAAPVLATDEASRVGIARPKAERAKAAGSEQVSDNTVKWAIIIGVGVLAALLIVALAN